MGGNAYMLRMIQRDGSALQVTADPEHFDASIAQTVEQLSSKTARLTLQQFQVKDGVLLAGGRSKTWPGTSSPAVIPPGGPG